jgi:hypothetical protein
MLTLSVIFTAWIKYLRKWSTLVAVALLVLYGLVMPGLAPVGASVTLSVNGREQSASYPTNNYFQLPLSSFNETAACVLASFKENTCELVEIEPSNDTRTLPAGTVIVLDEEAWASGCTSYYEVIAATSLNTILTLWLLGNSSNAKLFKEFTSSPISTTSWYNYYFAVAQRSSRRA